MASFTQSSVTFRAVALGFESIEKHFSSSVKSNPVFSSGLHGFAFKVLIRLSFILRRCEVWV